MNSLRLAASKAVLSTASKRSLSTRINKAPLIINAVSGDRAGIVSDMSEIVTEAGGSIRQAPAIRLGNHFSLTMLVEVPENKVEGLMKTLGTTDFHASVYEADADAYLPTAPSEVGYTGKFVLEGADHPGIIHKVTSLLCKHGLDIAQMETSDEIAPYGGTTLFQMVGIARAYEPLAKGFNPDKIKFELEELGDSINCDIYMEDFDGSEAELVA